MAMGLSEVADGGNLKEDCPDFFFRPYAEQLVSLKKM